MLGAAVLSRKQSGRAVKLDTDLHLLPRLRMSGAMSLFPPYVFMARTGTTSPLPSIYV